MEDLEERFAEIERRVKAIAAENRSYKKRIRELEKELDQTRHDARKAGHFHDKQLLIREKIERVLQSLEAVRNRE